MHRDVWRRQCTVAALAQSPGLVKCWGSNVHCGVRYRCLPANAESNDLASIKQIKTCCNICSFDLGYGSTSALVIWPQKKPCFLRKSSTVPPFCAKPLGDFLWFIHMVLIQSTFQYTSLKRSFKSLQEKPKHENPHLKKKVIKFTFIFNMSEKSDHLQTVTLITCRKTWKTSEKSYGYIPLCHRP